MSAVEVSDPARARGYALRGASDVAAYLHAYTDHSRPTSGIQVTVDVPRSGIATWTSPATGGVLATQAVAAGRQTLAAPPFVTDVALRIR